MKNIKRKAIPRGFWLPDFKKVKEKVIDVEKIRVGDMVGIAIRLVVVKNDGSNYKALTVADREGNTVEVCNHQVISHYIQKRAKAGE